MQRAALTAAEHALSLTPYECALTGVQVSCNEAPTWVACWWSALNSAKLELNSCLWIPDSDRLASAAILLCSWTARASAVSCSLSCCCASWACRVSYFCCAACRHVRQGVGKHFNTKMTWHSMSKDLHPCCLQLRNLHECQFTYSMHSTAVQHATPAGSRQVRPAS